MSDDPAALDAARPPGAAPALDGPVGIVVLNLGGPSSLDEVQPFLRNLFADPDVIQLGWARPLQGLLARLISKRRAPFSRAAYQQIGGRSPIVDESTAQARAVAEALAARGRPARAYVAMACWRPFSRDAVAQMRADGITRAVAVPLYPHYSRATTGASYRELERALAGTGIGLARVRSYPAAPAYVEAVADRVRDAIAALPEAHRASAPVLFSAHGLPESYIRRGDPYLDEVRTTVAAVTERLGLGSRAELSFQSRVGPQTWLQPYTEHALDRLAEAGTRALVICPIAFTGEHIETLQEIDILYRERATQRGIVHFSRARTVGCHPAYIRALTEAAEAALQAQGW